MYVEVCIYIYVCVAPLFIKTKKYESDGCLVLGTNLSKDSCYGPGPSAFLKAFEFTWKVKQETTVFSPEALNYPCW